MLLATLSTNSATATDGIDAEWKTLLLRPWMREVDRQTYIDGDSLAEDVIANT